MPSGPVAESEMKICTSLQVENKCIPKTDLVFMALIKMSSSSSVSHKDKHFGQRTVFRKTLLMFHIQRRVNGSTSCSHGVHVSVVGTGLTALTPEVCALTSQLFSLGLNPVPTTNCHPGASHAGWGINVCTVHRKDVTLAVPSASTTCLWTLMIISFHMMLLYYKHCSLFLSLSFAVFKWSLNHVFIKSSKHQ